MPPIMSAVCSAQTDAPLGDFQPACHKTHPPRAKRLFVRKRADTSLARFVSDAARREHLDAVVRAFREQEKRKLEGSALRRIVAWIGSHAAS
jgi:hypothetical protein